MVPVCALGHGLLLYDALLPPDVVVPQYVRPAVCGGSGIESASFPRARGWVIATVSGEVTGGEPETKCSFVCADAQPASGRHLRYGTHTPNIYTRRVFRQRWGV